MTTSPGADGCDMLVDAGGDATSLIHSGKEFAADFAKVGSPPDPVNTCGVQVHPAVAERFKPSGQGQVHTEG